MAKKSDPIHIKTSHEGKFTDYAKQHGGLDGKGKIKQSFIDQCMVSKDADVRSMAVFADNVRKKGL